jgi:predicted DCC family thiol-disulfide oxidoreductase YuxK
MAVIVFDGHWNLCNGLVNFVIPRDKKARFFFTANQHEVGTLMLAEGNMSGGGPSEAERETVFLFDRGELSDRSTAILRIVRQLPFPYKAGIVVPRVRRDG